MVPRALWHEDPLYRLLRKEGEAMTLSNGSRKTNSTSTAVETFRHRPFTRLDERGRATNEQFDREGMGVASKE